MDEGLKDSYDVYAEFFIDESSLFLDFLCDLFQEICFCIVEVVAKPRLDIWNKAKKAFVHAGKAQKQFRRFAAERFENLGDSNKVKLIFS